MLYETFEDSIRRRGMELLREAEQERLAQVAKSNHNQRGVSTLYALAKRALERPERTSGTPSANNPSPTPIQFSKAR